MKYGLIVDGNATIRKISRYMLESEGFSCEEAENGQEALKICIARMPDLVLTDLKMPVMSGLDFLRALRKLPNGANPKVIFCTTEIAIERIREALTAGANEYIMKPFDDDIMHGKLALVGLVEL